MLACDEARDTFAALGYPAAFLADAWPDRRSVEPSRSSVEPDRSSVESSDADASLVDAAALKALSSDRASAEGIGKGEFSAWSNNLRGIAGAVAQLWRPVASAVVIAGLLVGYGTRLGSGCTSGHGVCGISRGSARSIVATCVSISAGMLTVALVRAVGGA